MPSVPKILTRSCQNISRLPYIRPLSWIQMPFCLTVSSLGLARSYDVRALWHIAFDSTQIEPCKWVQCVSLVRPHRLTCNLTCLRHHVSRDPDLGSDIYLDQPKLPCRCQWCRFPKISVQCPSNVQEIWQLSVQNCPRRGFVQNLTKILNVI